MADQYISSIQLPNEQIYILKDTNAVKKSGDTMTGTLKFSGNNSRAIVWEDGTWWQRILTTDDSTANTAVFTFQQTSNSGGAWTDLFTIQDNGTVIATKFSGNGSLLTNLNASNISSGTVPFANLPTGTGASQVAIGNHGHGNITTDGKIGTAGKKKIVIVGTDNIVTTGAEMDTSTTNQWLNKKGEWSTPTAAQVGAATSGHNHDTTYLKLDGTNNMSGALHILGNQSSAWNDKGILFTNGSRIGENTTGGFGIYAKEKLYIKPNSGTASSTADGIIIDGDGLYPLVNNTENLGLSDHKWSTVYATTFDGAVLKLHQGTAVNPSVSSNARIEFDYSNGQPVYIAYTPNDSYRVPAGLKIMGNGVSTGSNISSPAWLEVEGDIYGANLHGTLATTNLSNIVTTTAKKFLKDTGDWTQVDWGDLTNVPTTFTPSNHSTDKLTSGTLGTAHGGTGNNSYTANRLVWTETATKFVASYHYASASKIGVNYTSEPTQNLYVNGSFKIGTVQQAITGNGTTASDAGSGNNRYKPALWKFNLSIATPTDGDIITIKIPCAGHSYGVFISTDDGTTYYPVSVGTGTSRLTTHYANGNIIKLFFSSSGSTADVFPVAGSTSRTTVTGGCWRVLNFYDDAPYGMRVYRQTSGYNGDYPLLVSRTAASSIGTADSNSSYTNNIYGVMWNDTTKVPTLNPSTGEIKAVKFTGTFNGNASTATKFNSTRKIELTGAVTGSATTDGSSGWSISTTVNHGHGDITSDGKIGSTADLAVYTTTDGKLTAGTLKYDGPSTSGNATAFITGVTQDSKGKISATKANLNTSGTWSGNAITAGHRWNAITKGQKWSRICLITPTTNVVGSSGILSVSCTRNSVVNNATFLITASHATKCYITVLGSTNYTATRIRAVVNSGGTVYIELYDSAQSIASGTAQTWQCVYLPLLSSTVTTYTEFTDGSTVPSNYTATNDFTAPQGDDASPIVKIERSGTTFTATRANGSTTTFTQQDSNTTSFTITANATDGLWDLTGTNGTNAVTYAVGAYESKGSSASFYTEAKNPSLTTRLNYDGYLYATKLYSGGSEVLTSHRTYTTFTGKPTANQTPGFGSTFTIQQISQSTTGQVSGTDRTVTIPDTSASASAAGLVDTSAQEFAGVKTFRNGIEIKGHIAGDGNTTGHGLYSGGGYHNAYNNIILHGDASTGSSGIAFVSDKVAANGTVTNVNQPSDRAFIQYHACGITTLTAEGTAPTLTTSTEAGRLVIGVGNDSGKGTPGDQFYLQTRGTTDLLHLVVSATPKVGVIPDTGETSGSVGGKNSPVYISSGVITAGDAPVYTIAWDPTNKKLTKTIGTTTTDVVTAATLKSAINVTASDLGLSNALHFIGITSTTLSDGSTTSTLVAKSTNSLSKTTDFVDGDVVMDGDQLREYVWVGEKWKLLGITTSEAYSKTATGNSWIASVSQGTDGKITATTGSLVTTGEWSGNAGSSTFARSLMNRGANTVSIIDDTWWGAQVTPSGHANKEVVWHQRWKQSGLKYTTTSNGTTTEHDVTDSGDITLWLSHKTADSNVLQVNMQIDGMIYAAGGFKGSLSGTASNATTTKDDTNSLYLTGVTSSATSTLKHTTKVTAQNGALSATTYNGLTLTAATTGFTVNGGSTTAKTLTVNESITLAAGNASKLAWYSSANTISGARNAYLIDESGTSVANKRNELVLGNNTNKNTNGSSFGRLALYSAGTTGTYLISAESSNGWFTATLPAATGVLAMIQSGTAKGSNTKPIKIASTGLITECSTYAGGTAVTLNGSSCEASTADFYAATSSGTAGQYLKSNGENTAPTWINPPVWWGKCDTAAAAKTVTCSDFTLSDGAVILVYFTVTNTGAVGSLTLNVNNTGAKSIKYLYNGNDPANIPDVGYLRAGNTYVFHYYHVGSTEYWVVRLHYNSNSTYYFESCYSDTAADTAAKIGIASSYTLPSTGGHFAFWLRLSNTSKNKLTLAIKNGSTAGTAKDVYINGAVTSSTNYTWPSGFYIGYYDGTNYHFRTDGKLPGDLSGNATTATTATNLANKPVLAAGTSDTNKITVKAGEKTSDEFTVPYATKTTITERVDIGAVVVQTGSSKLSHITLDTLLTWLITTKKYIPSKVWCHRRLKTSWAYADNDYLKIYCNDVNYEFQLAGCLIEWDGYAGDNFLTDNSSWYRLRIHTAPAQNSWDASSGYTKAPLSAVFEYFFNGNSWSKTWRCLTHFNWNNIVTGKPTTLSGYGITDAAASGHVHGNILNGGTMTATDTIANGYRLVITDATTNANAITRSSITFDGSTKTQALTPAGTWETFNNYSHPNTAGNKHIPTGGSTDQFLKYGGSSGTATWSALPTASTSAAGIIQIGSNSDQAMAGNTNVNNVYQKAITYTDYTNWRPLIWGNSNSGTEGFTPADSTANVFTAASLTCQPSTGTVRLINLKFVGTSCGISYKGTKAQYTMIQFIDNTADANGNGIKIGGGGVTIIGGGEAASNFTPASAGTEQLYLLSDQNIYLGAHCQDGVVNRVGLQIDTSGNLVPFKSDTTTVSTSVANSNAQSIGTSSNSWSAVYIGSSASYGGVNTTPIYWNAGVPTVMNNISLGITTNDDVTTRGVEVKNSKGAIKLYTAASGNHGLHEGSNWVIHQLANKSATYVYNWKSKGSATSPVYFTSDGEPAACTIIKSGSWKSGLATAFDANGYGEIGRGLDWHTTDSTNDYDVRLALDTTNKRLCIQGVGTGWNNAFAATTFYGTLSGNATSATKIAAKLATTTKTFLLGTSTTITATAANVDLIGDTGVYLTTTAGQLSAKSYYINDGTNEKVRMEWNSTDSSLDFVFA